MNPAIINQVLLPALNAPVAAKSLISDVPHRLRKCCKGWAELGIQLTKMQDKAEFSHKKRFDVDYGPLPVALPHEHFSAQLQFLLQWQHFILGHLGTQVLVCSATVL